MFLLLYLLREHIISKTILKIIQKNTALLCPDCLLNVAKWEETPVWMLCCWSVALVGDRFGKLVLENII